jgi:hypothetical protein
MSKNKTGGEVQKVKNFFGYKVNVVEEAIIRSRLAEYIKEGAENVHSLADANISAEEGEDDNGDLELRGCLEMPSWEFCSPVEKVFINFEKWLAHETWRRPVKKSTDRKPLTKRKQK